MADVFVSYARADRERVAVLATALQAAGFDVWWDPELLPGQRYAEEINAVLAAAKAVVVVWSANSIDRSWVLDEAAVGRERGVLAPVCIDDAPIPLGFRQIETIDLKGWDRSPSAPAILPLVERVRALCGPGAAPLGPPPSAHPPKKPARWAIATAAIVALGLAAAAINEVINPTPPVPEPSQDAAALGQGPGASARYGLTEEELIGFGGEDIIRIALSKTSLQMIERGAQGGDTLGQALACLAYFFGEGAPRNPEAARTRCTDASQAGEPMATHVLSIMARRGEGGMGPDPIEADRLLGLAADARDPRALTERAELSLDQGRPEEALPLARAAAEMGHYPAALLYGWMLETGQGAPPDEAGAFFWYDRAAEKAYPAALTASGRLLEDGRGVLQSYPRALARYVEAAAQGDGEAAYRLARLHEQGLGTPADRERALAHYRQAAEAGYEAAEAAVLRLQGGAPAHGTAPAPASPSASP